MNILIIVIDLYGIKSMGVFGAVNDAIELTDQVITNIMTS